MSGWERVNSLMTMGATHAVKCRYDGSVFTAEEIGRMRDAESAIAADLDTLTRIQEALDELLRGQSMNELVDYCSAVLTPNDTERLRILLRAIRGEK